MNPKLFLVASLCACVPAFAEPLTQSTFTEVVKDVNVVAASTKAAQPAAVNELVKAPDLVRTGPQSRAELTAADQTVTRIGANTVFSFEPTGRDMNLEKGNVLFHSPAGKGGGTIRSGGAAAAVLGTTLIVSSTGTGGFKVILLEGKGVVTLPNGKAATLTAGQLVFVQPGQTEFGPVLTINLGKLVAGSQLVNGFSTTLASMPLIQKAIDEQNQQLKKGRVQDTGLTPEDFGKAHQSPPKLGNGINAVDNTTYQSAVGGAISVVQIDRIQQLGPKAPFPPGFTPGSRGVSAVGTK
ncbi:MAG TPA: FecR family protein [Verrucomicrobiae bacterium]|nr:FecR family protein [Verrucomicrobiae bacterium]